jgi:hypothetical protein
MTSKVDICNMALSDIRAGGINDIDEATPQARACRLKYDVVRDRLLTEIAWQFNRSIRPLAPVTTEIFNWTYAYQYPVDCLKINRLIGEYEELTSDSSGYVSRRLDDSLFSVNQHRQQIPYEVFTFNGSKLIGTNEENLRIDFAMKVSDPNAFSNDFVLAFAHLLASEIAVPLVGGDKGRQFRSDSLQLYREYVGAALSNDLNDQYSMASESEFITVRR